MKKRVLAVFMSLCLLAGVLGCPGTERTAQAVTTTSDGLWNIMISSSGEYVTISKYNGNATEIVVPDTIDGLPVKYLNQSMFSADVRKNLVSVTFPGTVKTLQNSTLKEAVSLTRITLPEGLETLELYVFSGCTSLAEVTLPASLKTISSGCFYKCTSLESIAIPKGVSYFSGESFSGCTNLREITVDKENPSYTSVDGVVYSKDMTRLVYCPPAKPFIKIPDSVTQIGTGAFMNHQTLSAITLSDNITSIGASAFSGCQSLTEVDVPDSVTTIGNNAFTACKNLAEIHIPDSVTSMGEYALAGCSSLASVKLPKKLTELKKGLLQYCTGLTEIGWPENLTKIGGSCFMGCSGLTAIDIPDSVTMIDYDNFVGCGSLSAIHLPNSLEKIGTCVFAMGSTSLETVMLPEGTTSLGQNLFNSSKQIKYVVIPRSVTNFDYTSGTKNKLGFWGNSGSGLLGAVYLCYKDSTAEQFAIENDIPYELIGETYQVEGEYIYTIKEDDTVKIISYAGTNPKFQFPEELGGKTVTEYGTVKKLGGRTPNYHVTSLVLPEGMTSIGTEFRYYCCLSEITIPESVTEIQANALVPYEQCVEAPVIKGVEGSYAQTFAEECGYIFIPISTAQGHTHTYTETVTKQPTCTESGIRTYTCTGCDETYTAPIGASGHTVITDAAVAPTATTPGKTAGSHCGVCGTVLKQQEVIPATGTAAEPTTKPTAGPTIKPTTRPTAEPSQQPTTKPTQQPTITPTQKPEHTHVYTDVVTKRAAFLVDGSIQKVCSICSAVKETAVIYYPKTVQFSEDDYTYNGKVKTPSVKIKDRKGTLLKANRDYKVSYETGRKNPGKYQVTIEFLGKYRSKVNKSFTIRPKGTKLKKLKAKSKGFTATWKKNQKQTDGYQLQYCIGGDFTDDKTKTAQIKKNTTVKKKLSGLKKKKKYYVRIRTYKKVKVDGVSQTLYSDWSNTKTVKTKK